MEEKKNIPAEGETVTPEAPVAESPVADAPAPDLNTGPAAPQEQEGMRMYSFTACCQPTRISWLPQCRHCGTGS